MWNVFAHIPTLTVEVYLQSVRNWSVIFPNPELEGGCFGDSPHPRSSQSPVLILFIQSLIGFSLFGGSYIFEHVEQSISTPSVYSFKRSRQPILPAVVESLLSCAKTKSTFKILGI